MNAKLRAIKVTSQRKTFIPQQVRDFFCMWRETVNKDILATSRNEAR